MISVILWVTINFLYIKLMDIFVNIAGYTEAVLALGIMVFIGIASWFIRKPYEPEDKKDETATA